jgi:flagellar hook protein FlgE
MYTGVSGLLANAEGINVIGNNLSNVNTIGFKYGRMLFSDMLSADVGNGSQIGRGTQIQKVDNVFGQSSFEQTEVVTDLAIQGNSFFALGKPGGDAQVTAQSEAFLTRAGAFRTDGDLYLVNPDGYQLLDTNGDPIQFFSNDGATAGDFAKVSAVNSEGLITYVDVNGDTYYYTAANTVGVATSTDPDTSSYQKVAVINPANPGVLVKVGGTLFQNANGSGISTGGFSIANNKANGTSEKLFSNNLEQSNVDMAAQFVKMILTQRAYSANAKTITTSDEMTQEVINLKR